MTDRLIAATRLAEDGDVERAAASLDDLLARHLSVASALTTGKRQDDLVAAVREEFATIIGLVRALAVLREISPRSLDAVVAAGELASSRIVAAALAERGVPAVWVDARTIVTTDAEHTGAAPDMAETCARANAVIGPLAADGHVAVLGGFIGATAQGVTTTLGRGGSDYSAAIIGACLGVDEIQIWTDVDGMLTADPRIIPEPQLVRQLSFAEASELAYFGAKVLHPSTILPAVSKNIPVRILNSRRPEVSGTLITAEARPPDGRLSAIACKRGVTVIDITSTRMLMAHGFLRRLFEVFERFKTAVDVVTTSEVSVSVTVDDTRRLDAIVDNLRKFADVSCEPDMAIICAVGENLRTGSDAVRPRGDVARPRAAAARVAGRVAAEHHLRAAGRRRHAGDDAPARGILSHRGRHVTRLLLVGHGRMGKLVESLAADYGCEVAGIIDRHSSAAAGQS